MLISFVSWLVFKTFAIVLEPLDKYTLHVKWSVRMSDVLSVHLTRLQLELYREIRTCWYGLTTTVVHNKVVYLSPSSCTCSSTPHAAATARESLLFLFPTEEGWRHPVLCLELTNRDTSW
jgi:hypothetical protein